MYLFIDLNTIVYTIYSNNNSNDNLLIFRSVDKPNQTLFRRPHYNENIAYQIKTLKQTLYRDNTVIFLHTNNCTSAIYKINVF